MENFKIIFKDYFALLKPSILLLVIITTLIGYFIGKGDLYVTTTFVLFSLGSALLCGGVSTINHLLEINTDKLMDRTKDRPLPSGRISLISAIIYATVLTITGLVLFYKISFLMFLGGFVTFFIYCFVYTPLKKIHHVNTIVGAIPGALPPMGGYLAGKGEIDAMAWVLFFIVFFWQHPHFYAIAWMYKDDYIKGGYKMLSSNDKSGRKTSKYILFFSLLLFTTSLIPTYLNVTHSLYTIGISIAGLFLLHKVYLFIKETSIYNSRQILKSTVYYIQFLFVLILLDKYIG